MPNPPTYSQQLRERAVRMVAEITPDYQSEEEAINAVAALLGIDSSETLRKWVTMAKPRPVEQDSHGPIWRGFKALWRHPIISGTAVVVLGGLILLYSQTLLGVQRKAPNLQVDGIALSAARFGGSNFTELLPFKIDIKLLNTGSQPAIINSVRLVVQNFTTLPICASQGELLVTGTYNANMPTDPSPNQVVNVPTNQVVPPNGTDRFDVLLHTRLLPGHARSNVYLYRLRIFLVYNVRTSPVDAGEVLVSLPVNPVNGEYYWSHYYAAHPQIVRNAVYPGGLPQYKKCVIKNTYALRSILRLSAMRTSQLAAVQPQLAYSGVP